MARKELKARNTSRDIYYAIARMTGLHRDEVRNVFKAYAQILETMGLSDNRPEDITIPLPFLGKFKFGEVVLEEGRVFSLPKSSIQNQNIKAIVEEEVRYKKLMFNVSRTFRDNMKDNAMKGKLRVEKE